MSATIFMISSTIFSCSETPKGNPQLVKDAQELAQMGCACTDVACLHKVEVRGQSYAKIRLGSGAKELKENERMEFNLALGKWADCEYKLTQNPKKGK